jgi:hypothetical protein
MRFEVLAAVVMNVAIIASCNSYVFQPSHLLHSVVLLGRFLNLKLEVMCFSKMLIHIRTTGFYIPGDDNMQ